MIRVRMTRLVLLLLIVVMVYPVNTVFGQTKGDYAQVIQLAENERKAAYLDTVFETGGWKTGTVVEKNPYSIVIGVDSMNDKTLFQLQIWRGVAARVENDLHTDWDALWIDSSGKVIDVTLNVQRSINDYFKAPFQDKFKTVEYATSYPWVNLPTDAEGKAIGAEKVPDDGLFDVYHVLPTDGTATISSQSDEIKQQIIIPNKLSEKPIQAIQGNPFLNKIIDPIPNDIKTHWAKSYILDLMGKSIMVGYPDHTIRPNRVLTKAEFTSMFVHALRLDSTSDAASSFSDVQGQWSEQVVNTAVESGLVSTESKEFFPNSAITRLEAVRMLGLALEFVPLKVTQTNKKPAQLTDLQSLSPKDKDFIHTLSLLGILSGDPDGKFRPTDTLTRAEACKVVSAFLQLEKGE
jgi:hypothetical protein